MSDDGATDDSSSETDGPTPAIVQADEPTTDDAAQGDEHEDGRHPPEPEPTPQSEALRRQQLGVGVGVSALAGVAVVVAGIQQFPGLPFIVYLLFGMAATTLLFGLLLASLFTSGTE
jgi:hypothetical protein